MEEMLSFNEIVLTAEELEALRAVEKDAVQLEPGNEAAFQSLRAYGFVEIIALAKFTPSAYVIPKGALITNRGKAYLRFWDERSKNNIHQLRHDYSVNIINGAVGAITGAILTLLIEHHSEIIHFFNMLLQDWLK